MFNFFKYSKSNFALSQPYLPLAGLLFANADLALKGCLALQKLQYKREGQATLHMIRVTAGMIKTGDFYKFTINARRKEHRKDIF